MTKIATALRSLFFLAPAALLAAYLGLPGGAVGPVPPGPAAQSTAGIELPCHRIPNLPEAAERYFARDGEFLIGSAKGPGDAAQDVGVLTFDACFGGFPSISADGPWRTFSSSRGGKPGQRTLFQYIMDISSLGLGPR
jgi:hypothetical protein